MELHQWTTYPGMLAGAFLPFVNGRELTRTLERAKPYCMQDAAPYLIDPVMVDLPALPVVDVHQRLPEVACVGRFDSEAPPDCDMHYATLTVVWFQREFALPIDSAVADCLRALDWERLAKGWKC